MISILLEVMSKPNICMLTPPKPGNDHAHGLELRISSKGYAIDATIMIYRKIWESGALSLTSVADTILPPAVTRGASDATDG